MDKTYFAGRNSYKNFSNAYFMGRYNNSKKPIRVYTNDKSTSKLVWGNIEDEITILGKNSNSKSKEIIKVSDLFEAYINILENAEKYFSTYESIHLNDNHVNLISFDITHLEVILEVVAVLSQNDARCSLGSFNLLNFDLEKIISSVNTIKADRKKEIKMNVLKKKNHESLRKEKELLDIYKIIDDLTHINKKQFNKPDIPDKEYWVEIRLQTSVIIRTTKTGDKKSTLNLYTNLKEKYPTKEIALVRNNNGSISDCFSKSEVYDENIAIQDILNSYNIVLKELQKIKAIRGNINQEIKVFNFLKNKNSHILENSSISNEFEAMEYITDIKCFDDSRRQAKTILAMERLLPDESKISDDLMQELSSFKEGLENYVNGGAKYLNNEIDLNISSYNNVDELGHKLVEFNDTHNSVVVSHSSKKIYGF